MVYLSRTFLTIMRSKPDRNQPDVVEAIQLSGRQTIDMHNVPLRLREFKGFPDLLIVDDSALVILSDDPKDLDILRIILKRMEMRYTIGCLLPAEVKMDGEDLREDQEKWWQKYNLTPLILRSRDQVFKWFGREIQ